MSLLNQQKKLNIKKKIIVMFIISEMLLLFMMLFSFLTTRQTYYKQASDNIMSNYKIIQSYIDQIYSGNWAIKGESIIKGSTNINKNYSLMDNIKKVSSDDCIIFMKGFSINSTIKDVKAAIPKNVQDKLTKNGFVYEKLSIDKNKYRGVFIPIKDKAQNVIGVWFQGSLESENTRAIFKQFMPYAAIFLNALIIFACIFLVIYKFIISNILVYNQYLKSTLFFNKDLTKNKKIENMDGYEEFWNSNNIINEYSNIHSNILKEISSVFRATLNDIDLSEKELEKITLSLPERISSVKSFTVIMEQYSKEVNEIFSDVFKKEGFHDKHLIKGMDEVISFSKEINNDSKELGEVKNIIGIIMEQLNMLYVNAAIEVTKAGEAGQSFSIIAEEIRRLSEKIGELSKVSGSVIEGIQEDSEGFQRSLERVIEYNSNFFDLTISRDLEKKEAVNNFIERYDKDNNEVNEIIHNALKYLDEISRSTGELNAKIQNYEK